MAQHRPRPPPPILRQLYRQKEEYMNFWEFVAMLGSPAKPSKMEIGLEKVSEVADRIAKPVYECNNTMDQLRAAERIMRDV